MSNKLIFNNRDNKNVESDKIKKDPRSELNLKQLAQELESTNSKLRMAAVEKLSGNVDALRYVARYSDYEDARMAVVNKLSGNVDALKYVAVHSNYENTRNAANNEINKLSGIDSKFVKDLVNILMKTQI